MHTWIYILRNERETKEEKQIPGNKRGNKKNETNARRSSSFGLLGFGLIAKCFVFWLHLINLGLFSRLLWTGRRVVPCLCHLGEAKKIPRFDLKTIIRPSKNNFFSFWHAKDR